MTPLKILIIGANGQIGTELAEALAQRHGPAAVVTSDLAPQGRVPGICATRRWTAPTPARCRVVERHGVTQIYLLAAALSARGEQHPQWAWDLNMKGLLNVLELARTAQAAARVLAQLDRRLRPRHAAADTPQHTVMDPTTVYGISKLAGEGWCAWYHRMHGVDVRSLRYPGLISWKTPPGGGTTDYAVDIFHAAPEGRAATPASCGRHALPMMYMPDAIRATLELMDAPAEAVPSAAATTWRHAASRRPRSRPRSARQVPGFEMDCAPDFRQAIADSWPRSIDDSVARQRLGLVACGVQQGVGHLHRVGGAAPAPIALTGAPRLAGRLERDQRAHAVTDEARACHAGREVSSSSTQSAIASTCRAPGRRCARAPAGRRPAREAVVREVARLQDPHAVVVLRAVHEHDRGALRIEGLAAGVGVGRAAVDFQHHGSGLACRSGFLGGLEGAFQVADEVVGSSRPTDSRSVPSPMPAARARRRPCGSAWSRPDG
jgi:nucleoside-diphosphate-sugar epimerase